MRQCEWLSIGAKNTGERKHAILFAATLLCARKVIETMESDKPNFAEEYFYG